MDFGKLNFSVSFNPTSAFPLDARYYFDNLAEAKAAAKSAKEVGSTETTYFYGETICVVSGSSADLYVILPDGTLKNAGGSISINTSVFETDEDGKLSLIGFAEAAAGAQLTKNADGSLSWITPSKTTVEGLSSSIATIEETLYDKTEGSEAEGNFQVVSTGLVSRVAALEEKANTDHIIASVSSEFVVVSDDTKDRELQVNAIDKAKIVGLEDALSGKVDKVDGSRLITSAEAEKLTSVETNVINSVDTNVFSIVTDKEKSIDRQLILSSVPATKVLVTVGENTVKSLDEILNGTTTENGLISMSSVSVKAIGDMTKLVNYEEDITLVDEINNIYERLTWEDMQEE